MASVEQPSPAKASIAFQELHRLQNGDPPARATPADAFRAALVDFVKEPRLDMGKLASDLGISKATLYRWTGPRDHLLGEILVYFSDLSMDQAFHDATDLEGIERVATAYRSYVGSIVSFEPLARFVRNETPLALRVITTRDGRLQAHIANRLRTQLLEPEAELGNLTMRAPAGDIAYAITRVTEAFIYNDSVASIEPDVEAAWSIVRLMID